MSSNASDILKQFGSWVWNNIFKQIWNAFIKDPWVRTIGTGLIILTALRFLLPYGIMMLKGLIIKTSNAVTEQAGGNILQLDGSTSLLSQNNMELYFNGLKQIIN